MGFKTKTHTEQYYEDSDAGSFPLPFTGEFCQERLHVTADGLTAILGMLCTDDDPRDPFEEYDEGEFFQFNNRYTHHTPRPEIDEFKRIIRANPGRVVCHSGTGDVHGPGTTYCRPTSAPLTIADTKGIRNQHGNHSAAERALDNSDGYYIVPEDATDPAAYAKSVLETYSAYCNGEVYGVMVWTYHRPTVDEEWNLDEESRDSECWGFSPADYAKEQLDEQFNAAVKETTTP